MGTVDKNQNATANMVMPFAQDGKCVTKNTMYDNSGYVYNGYNVKDDDINTVCNRRSWKEHTFMLLWQDDVIIVWVDPQFSYNSSTNMINIKPDPNNNASFKAYNQQDTQLWKDSKNSIGRNPFDQELKIVMNIAANRIDERQPVASPEAIGSQMKISNVTYYALM